MVGYRRRVKPDPSEAVAQSRLHRRSKISGGVGSMGLMAQTFSTCDCEQALLLPRDIRDWLPADRTWRGACSTSLRRSSRRVSAAYRQDGWRRPASAMARAAEQTHPSPPRVATRRRRLRGRSRASPTRCPSGGARQRCSSTSAAWRNTKPWDGSHASSPSASKRLRPCCSASAAASGRVCADSTTLKPACSRTSSAASTGRNTSSRVGEHAAPSRSPTDRMCPGSQRRTPSG